MRGAQECGSKSVQVRLEIQFALVNMSEHTNHRIGTVSLSCGEDYGVVVMVQESAVACAR